MVLDWCCMCKNGAESVEHLLLHCSFTGEIWDMVFGLFGVYWVMPRTTLELLECWQGCFGNHRNFLIWRVVPHCLMWSIWRERNRRSFENCERSYVEIKFFFLRSLFDWVVGWGIHPGLSFLDFLELCSLRLLDLVLKYTVFLLMEFSYYSSKIKNKGKANKLGD
jgi:hypothetical protein